MKKYILLLIVPLLFSCGGKSEKTESSSKWSANDVKLYISEFCVDGESTCNCYIESLEKKYDSYEEFVNAFQKMWEDENDETMEYFMQVEDECQ